MKVDWIEGQGFDSNIFLIRDEVSLLVDSGTGSNHNWTRRKLKSLGTKPEDLDILVNTHCHFDHVGGDSKFLKASGCELMASIPASEALKNADEEMTLSAQFGGKLEPLEVSWVLKNGDEIDLGERSLTVLSTPGHSHGSISLYEPQEKVLFSGDAVFKGGIGRIDLPSSDSEALEESLKKLADLEAEKLYPGHGPIAEEKARKYIKDGLKLLV